jgi:uncharacterized protein
VVSVHLLDVNVLLALFDPQHVHHEATCPISENGFVRISSSPGYPARPGEAPRIVEMLNEFCDIPDHRFWPEDMRLQDIVEPGAPFTHNQVTDLYLLGLAVHNGGKLATLDRRIPAALVDGGDQALAVVPV